MAGTADVAAPAESGTGMVADPSAQALPPRWAGPVRRIVRAVAAGQLAGAGQLARQLQQEVETVRGPQHPEALRAREVRAHLAHLAGEHALAAALYREVAAAWARRGAAACRPASRNARACERISAASRAVAGPARGRTAVLRAGWRVTAVAVTVGAALAVGVDTLAAESRSAAGSESVALAAAPVVQVLRVDRLQALPSAPLAPSPAEVSPVATETPAPEPPQPPSGSSPQRPGHPGRPAPTHAPHAPSPARTPERPLPYDPAPQDVCAAGSRYGRLPPDLVAMCRSVYGG